MFIKSILLDGFKSYGNRVEIDGFDPQFNAITGLNGTGKSNILDSICFVLGITNLSNVRAGSLQELIYKHGQAGVTKATVSITFDNRDRSQCPIGYENHEEITVTRQVVMGGKNKYLINGINVQNKRVSDLFCSVQLNVNNPHFLIMQGRITKVLNMKPAEILSMVEEAAGTRMYEAKKQAAQKTIEKKDAKLRELNEIIREDIAPKLQKLQDERTQFQEYQKVVRELENLTKLHVAYRFVSAEENAAEAQSKVTGVEEQIKIMKQTIKNNKQQAKELEDQIDTLSRKLDEESAGVVSRVEQETLRLEKEEAARGAALAAARDAQAGSQARARLLRAALHDDTHALDARTTALQELSSSLESVRAANSSSEAALAEAQQQFLAVSSGLGGASDSLQDQLMEAKQTAAEASTRVAAASLERRHAQARLQTLERDWQASSDQYRRDQAAIQHHQDQLDALQGELARLGAAGEQAAREERVRVLRGEARRARDAADALAARLQRCSFSYTPPQPDFDLSRVAGTICRLIDVCDPIYCTALETAAGGRLYNVVVDTEVTSKLLLQRGRLQTRTTIIPLNKISATRLDPHIVRLAQEIGGGPEKVQLALELVSFPERVRPAVQWVLGNTLVCRDLDTAKRVTFHPRVRRRCVTLDGDVFDPAGTLSGGARAQGGSVLLQLQQLKQLERAASEAEAELQQLAAGQAAAEHYAATQQRYEMMSHELEVVRARLAATAHAQTHAEIEALRAQVSELSATMERELAAQRAAEARAGALGDQLADLRGHREREFKKAEAALNKAKQEAASHGGAWKQRSQELSTLSMEVGELERAVAAGQLQLREAEGAALQLHHHLDQAQQEHALAAEAVKQKQAELKKHKADIAVRNTDISRLAQQREQLAAASGDLELKVKELDYSIKELQAEAAECQRGIRQLVKEHPWIESERGYFGLAGGLYDFSGRQASAAGPRLAQLAARRDGLARGLNSRAHTLLGKEEEQYHDMLRKKSIVEADRAKLVQVMAELDEKKRQTLVAACEQVNRDFGSIFSTLLPGAQAQLRPPPGRSVLDGLEVKVGFNNAWKESLGELSGGQRSLVALSLVLAMLLFKPAPLYILDEVDAALDLSHTQNIGHMLKEHFKHSQFIIVSLKDGMFNNANVLFRTRFVDGMSAVQRTVNTRR